ncbi:MAG: hypothetical protein AB9873_18040 [Syntrophobacteraceae bacterium]
MVRIKQCLALGSATFLLAAALLCCGFGDSPSFAQALNLSRTEQRALLQTFSEGRGIFRFDTFGDEAFWGDTLQLHQAIAGQALGGVGPGLSPRSALNLGLKVDAQALPARARLALKRGTLNLDDPSVTVQLLRSNAVLGVKGTFGAGGVLTSVGITCALCHSTVDDSLAPGVGRRLDGWANRDLNVGAVISLAPNLGTFQALLGVDRNAVLGVLATWGPGKFDALMILDGKTVTPAGGSSATLIPPVFGLAGVNLHTSTGWGSVPYWNAFVAILEMGGKGVLFDSRLNDGAQFPIAATNGFGNVRNDPDLVTPKLPALHRYQLSLSAPVPPAGSFDAVAAGRGEVLFRGKADCARCHVPPLFTEPGWNMHTPLEIGIDSFQADRAPDRAYRTPPLKGLWTHTKGGFYHDGRFATLSDVIDHYNAQFVLGLTDPEKADLIEYLRSL